MKKNMHLHIMFFLFSCATSVTISLEPAYPVTAGKKPETKELYLGSKPCHPLYITKQVNKPVLNGEKNS